MTTRSDGPQRFGEVELNSPIPELIETLDYIRTLLPADADPVHRQRLREIVRRVMVTGEMGQLGSVGDVPVFASALVKRLVSTLR